MHARGFQVDVCNATVATLAALAPLSQQAQHRLLHIGDPIAIPEGNVVLVRPKARTLEQLLRRRSSPRREAHHAVRIVEVVRVVPPKADPLGGTRIVAVNGRVGSGFLAVLELPKRARKLVSKRLLGAVVRAVRCRSGRPAILGEGHVASAAKSLDTRIRLVEKLAHLHKGHRSWQFPRMQISHGAVAQIKERSRRRRVVVDAAPLVPLLGDQEGRHVADVGGGVDATLHLLS